MNYTVLSVKPDTRKNTADVMLQNGRTLISIVNCPFDPQGDPPESLLDAGALKAVKKQLELAINSI